MKWVLIATIVVGLIAGLLASAIMKVKTGVIVDMILGIVGGVVGGWISTLITGVNLMSGQPDQHFGRPGRLNCGPRYLAIAKK